MGLKRQMEYLRLEAQELIDAIDEWEGEDFTLEGKASKFYEEAVDEMVDVSALINQIRENIPGCAALSQRIAEFKITRTMDRMERGYYLKQEDSE